MTAIITEKDIINSVHTDDFYEPIRVTDPGQSLVRINGARICTKLASFELHKNSDKSKMHPVFVSDSNCTARINGVPILADNFKTGCALSNTAQSPDPLVKV